jgi:hypothetical protein
LPRHDELLVQGLVGVKDLRADVVLVPRPLLAASVICSSSCDAAVPQDRAHHLEQQHDAAAAGDDGWLVGEKASAVGGHILVQRRQLDLVAVAGVPEEGGGRGLGANQEPAVRVAQVVLPASSSMLESTDFLSERLNRIGGSEYLPLLKARHGRRTRLGGGMFVS